MWTLLVLGHRDPRLYRDRCIRQLDEVVGLSFFDRLICSYDGPGVSVAADTHGPWEQLATGRRSGLTANVQQAWDALGDDEWVFHVEEDFLVLDAPLDLMRDFLAAHPWVAQMVLERQPVNPSELANGGLLGADNIPTWKQGWRTDSRMGPWRQQDHLFSFNPCVYHSSIATVAGTETEVTERLRADWYKFGFWGAQGDAPRCEHIGVEGGMGSAGWRA